MSEVPGADRDQLLVPVRHRDHEWGHVVARDPKAGQQLRCPCGALRWTAFGQAERHGRDCAQALTELARLAERRDQHALALVYRRRAIAAALKRAGRRGYTARELATILGYTPGHVRTLMRAAEQIGTAERRGRLPARWRGR